MHARLYKKICGKKSDIQAGTPEGGKKGRKRDTWLVSSPPLILRLKEPSNFVMWDFLHLNDVCACLRLPFGGDHVP